MSIPSRGQVSAATITLNGQVVLSPENFNPNIHSINISVTLNVGENVVVVTMDGKPGSKITLSFTRE